MAEESLTPVDKDQLQGLVSGPKPSLSNASETRGDTEHLGEQDFAMGPARLTCVNAVEIHPRLPQETNKL
jgi:N-acetylmuramic acid 6-phosphate (MurNAc-6-P) etherase